MLAQKGVGVRVVSMPSTDVFDAQSPEYKESVLPAGVTARISVEAGVTDYWYKYIGAKGRAIGVDTFGMSAPYEKVYEYFGLTARNVAEAAQECMAGIAAGSEVAAE